MTTILLLGQKTELTNVYDATDLIIKWHVRAAQARFQWEMEQRVYDLESAKLKGVEDYQTYVNRLKSLDEKHRYWSIHDSRPIFFLDEFAGLVDELKVIWGDIDKPKDDYERQLNKRIKKAFDGYKGAKLHLQEDNPQAVEDFVIGKLVKSRNTTKGEVDSAD